MTVLPSPDSTMSSIFLPVCSSLHSVTSESIVVGRYLTTFQLAKCSSEQAARKSFPQDLGEKLAPCAGFWAEFVSFLVDAFVNFSGNSFIAFSFNRTSPDLTLKSERRAAEGS